LSQTFLKRTLLVNSSWEPLNFLDDRRAISLLINEKVEVISIWDGEMLIPSLGQELPAVLRLRKQIKKPFKMPKFRRKVVFTRDSWSCQYCGIQLSTKEATIDHVIPKFNGGKTDWKNCVTACVICNRRKGCKRLEFARMSLIKQPEIPNVIHFWDLRKGNIEWHPMWDSLIIHRMK
jgi:5-methylcytosine-specific restriction endonuclease McrA